MNFLNLPQNELAILFIVVVSFFLTGTLLSRAGRLSKSLAPWVKSRVHVEVWGRPLEGSGEQVFEIDRIAAFGAGLLIHLRPIAGGPRSLLKIAQPLASRFENGRLEIADARYVSWGGKKLPRGSESKMPALVLARV
jgi:hypothetical protein